MTQSGLCFDSHHRCHDLERPVALAPVLVATAAADPATLFQLRQEPTDGECRLACSVKLRRLDATC